MSEAPFIDNKYLDKAGDIVHSWLFYGYTPEEVQEATESSESLKEAILYTIMDLGFEAKATMHYDDPSLIEFHKELDELLSHIKQ